MKILYETEDGNLIVVMCPSEFRKVTGAPFPSDMIRIGNDVDVKDPSNVVASANRLRDAIDKEFPRK